jgi:DNA-binding NtrC family response regulator
MFSESTILVLGGKSDEPENIARILADQYRVIEAENPEDGLAQLSHDVDAVVADLEGERSSVFEFLQRGKAQQPETPFLAVLNDADVNAAVEAMKLGAADCLVKPVKAEELQEAVAEMIENSRTGLLSGSNPERPSNYTSHIDIPPGTSLEDLERAAVEQALAQHHGNRTHAAKTLGISVRTLQRKLKAWGIPLVATHPNSRSDNFIMPTSGGHTAYSVHAHSAN